MNKNLHQISKYILSGLLIVLSNSSFSYDTATPESQGLSSEVLDSLRPIVEPLVDEGRLPNYLISIYKNEKLVFEAKKGFQDYDNKIPVATDTIFWQASMSKPMVAAGVLKLIEDGKLSLEDKLEDFYPQFSDLMVFPEGSYGNTLQTLKRPITIRDLITHTSGFTYGTSIIGQSDVADAYDQVNPIDNYQRNAQDNMTSLSELPLVGQPGDAFNYSVGIDVLGAVIEKVSGQGLAEYLSDTIFKPAGMSDSGFFFSEPDQLARKAVVYSQIVRTVQVPGQTVSFQKNDLLSSFCSFPPMFPNGGGGLCTTSADFAKFLYMLLNDGKANGNQVLKPETVKLMFTNLLPPELGRNALTNTFGSFAGNQYFSAGLGLVLEGETEEIDYVWWAGAANTLFWADPKENVVGTFLTQHFPVAYNIMDTLEETVDIAKLD
jgi:CubicO group peptidase (beta-lactamase class C family)